jgi:hypothetical protein
MNKTNKVVIALQGLCLILVLVIQFTITQVTIPKLIYSEYREFEAIGIQGFTVLSVMLGMLIIVLEFCKEYKTN